MNQVWKFNKEVGATPCAPGVERKILAHTGELMCVENYFKKGAVGALHHHPHTQITYVVSGKFEFEIDGVKKVVQPGDTMLKKILWSMAVFALKKEFYWIFFPL